MKTNLYLLMPMILIAGCLQTEAAQSQNQAANQEDKLPRENASEITKVLAKMQKADTIEDPARRCLDYPSPPGVTWTKESIAARCALLAPYPKFLSDGVAKISTEEGAVIWDVGFKALLDDPHASPAIKDGRLNRAVGSFSSGAALPSTEKWLARNPKSPFAHAAKGASLLAQAIRMRGTKFSAETAPGDLDSTQSLAEAASRELQQAYQLEPRLSPACALRTTALQLSAGSDVALEQGRACAQAHPESYFAASSWASAAEPRWGGSEAEQSDVMDFLERNASRNPLLASIVGKIKSYSLLPSQTITRQDVEQLQAYASMGPNSGLLDSISIAWEELGRGDLSMAFLSSAIRFDFDLGDKYRFMRASLNSVTHPEWAVIDYRILNEIYEGDPSIAMFLAQAEENARNGTGDTFAREGSVTYKGDHERKATLLSQCLRMGTSDREPDRGMRDCSDSLIKEWPDDSAAWYVHSIVLQHREQPGWQKAAQRYLIMADEADASEKQRIEVIKSLLERTQAPSSEDSSLP